MHDSKKVLPTFEFQNANLYDEIFLGSKLSGSKCSVEGLLAKGVPLLLTTLEFFDACKVFYKGETAWTN